ncbi:MAG TPA: ribosome maturation factor RimM [Stellaceae bacterium]
MASNQDRRVLMGVITGAHGVRGLVRVKSFTANADGITAYGALEDERGERSFALERVGAAKGVLIMRLDGVADRDAAERLKGVRLYLPRAALPEPGEEEYYHADLVGLAAMLKDGSALGRVKAVHAHGAGDSLEVERPDGRTVIVPFTTAVVPVVDIEGGRLVVDPPEGLLDNRPVEAELGKDEES